MPKTKTTHLVVAMVNAGDGFHLRFETHTGTTPEVAAARFLACQDLQLVGVYEFAVVEGAGTLVISPMQPLRTLPTATTRVQ